MFTPGASIGMITRLCFVYLSPSGFDRPMNRHTLHRGSAAPLDHHLRPLITYSSPSRVIVECRLVGSELATSGSVIPKHDRISPSSRGFSHVAFCSSVPNSARISML